MTFSLGGFLGQETTVMVTSFSSFNRFALLLSSMNNHSPVGIQGLVWAEGTILPPCSLIGNYAFSVNAMFERPLFNRQAKRHLRYLKGLQINFSKFRRW